MPSGSGGTFGQALVAMARQMGYQGRGELSTYRAKGWHAQLAKLTSSPRGYQAAEAAGLNPSPETFRRWMLEEQAPGKANRAKIQEAYDLMAGRFPRELLERMQFEIRGRVDMGGGDVRDRGNGSAPLRIDGRAGDWDRIEEAWEDGDLDADLFEELFYEDVIAEDIGDTSDGIGFPGGGYAVSGR